MNLPKCAIPGCTKSVETAGEFCARHLRSFSSGGGVQSTAALVLSAERRIDFPVHLFSNVGDDSEHPATLEYVREHLIPYAERHGIEFHELQRVKRDGSTETLYGRLMKEGSRSLPIPVRMSNGAPGSRACTIDFKIRVLSKWHQANGASEDNPAIVGIGFSTDEMERLGNSTRRAWEFPVFPLIDLGLSRADCMEITRKAGLPPAPKSSCWFCPFHRPSTWAEMRRDEPDLFWQAVNLEATLNKRRADLTCPGSGNPARERYSEAVECSIHGGDLWGCPGGEDADGSDYCPGVRRVRVLGSDIRWGAQRVPGTMHCDTCQARFPASSEGVIPDHGRDPVFLTRFARPLDEAIVEAQPSLFDDHGGFETCDEGVCFI